MSRRRRIRLTGASAVALVLALSPAAAAHGVQGRAETAIPISGFFVAAGAVMFVSFAVLTLGWSRPKLRAEAWRPAPGALSRLLLSRRVVALARGLTLAAFLFVALAAAVGSTRLSDNVAPLAIFVIWWVGLVPVSVLLGNVWRELNPWATLARLLRLAPAAPRPLPAWVGVWPAAALLVVFAWLELVYPTAGSPRLIAGLIGAYSLLTLGAMRRYGIGAWLDRGELFTVYSGTLATLSPIEVRQADGGRRLGFRPPLVGATRLTEQPGRVAFVAALIATVAFDGLSGSDIWGERSVAASERLIGLGLSPYLSDLAVASIGLGATVALLYGAYRACSTAAARLGQWEPLADARETASRFAHTLVPIALAYFAAHYFSLFAFQSQDLLRLASDPFGTGADLFGTAGHTINFRLVSPETIWGVQVIAIVAGHILALVLAHERALQLAPRPGLAARSQLPMLILMVLLTVGGLWSLSEGMTRV